jgi:hypothetical protein
LFVLIQTVIWLFFQRRGLLCRSHSRSSSGMPCRTVADLSDTELKVLYILHCGSKQFLSCIYKQRDFLDFFSSFFSLLFFFFFMYFIQHCFICRPSDCTVSEDAGIEPRTVIRNTSFLSYRTYVPVSYIRISVRYPFLFQKYLLAFLKCTGWYSMGLSKFSFFSLVAICPFQIYRV